MWEQLPFTCSLGRQWLARRHVITLNCWCDLDFSICTATPWCVSICMWYLRVFVRLGLGAVWDHLVVSSFASWCIWLSDQCKHAAKQHDYRYAVITTTCIHHILFPPLSLTSIKIDQSDWDKTLLCTGGYSDNPVWWTAFQMNCKDYVIKTFPPHMKPTQQRQKHDRHGKCNLFCKQMTA